MEPYLSRVSIATPLIVVLFFHLNLGSTDQDPNYSFLKDATQAPHRSYYDYIIVGGGTAGCPLAATLSEHFNVLLLERGGSPYGNENITHPTSIIDTLTDTSPTSPAQHFVSEDGVMNVRARVLGSGTCINVGFYSRASPEQVRMMGLDGALANESFHWVEKGIISEPHPLQWQSGLKDGLGEAGGMPDNGFTLDHIPGAKISGVILDAAGRRHTSADLLRYADPRRLTVLLHATVSKILFHCEGRLAARGVAFRDAAGMEHTAYLNHGHHGGEVIVSAGALGSPQLLMLSGIGPADQLKSLGIDIVVDHPMVGQGMTDNPMNFISFISPSPVEIAPAQVAGITRLGGGNYVLGLSGLNLAALLGGVVTGTGHPPEGFHMNGGVIVSKVAYPASSGHLRLVSRDPEGTPSVTFNYFSEPQDLRTCVEGLRLISKVVESKAFSEYRHSGESAETLLRRAASAPVNFRSTHRDGDDHNGVMSLEQYCNETVVTMWHYHGGCQIGRVVDHDLRVVGVDGIRVVDGSVFNFAPGVTPQATVMMLGRYMGVKIMRERKVTKDLHMCAAREAHYGM